jgi:hypothetical protein
MSPSCHPFPSKYSKIKRTSSPQDAIKPKHTIQSSLATAKSHIVTLSRRGKPFPLKFFGPKGQAKELFDLLCDFEGEIREGAKEMEGCLRGVGDCEFWFLLLRLRCAEGEKEK